MRSATQPYCNTVESWDRGWAFACASSKTLPAGTPLVHGYIAMLGARMCLLRLQS